MKDRELLREKIMDILEANFSPEKRYWSNATDQILALLLPQEVMSEVCHNCIHYGTGEQHTCAVCEERSNFEPKKAYCGDAKTYTGSLIQPLEKVERCECEQGWVNMAKERFAKLEYNKNGVCSLCGKLIKPTEKQEIEPLNYYIDEITKKACIFPSEQEKIDKINELVRDNKKLWEATRR